MKNHVVLVVSIMVVLFLVLTISVPVTGYSHPSASVLVVPYIFQANSIPAAGLIQPEELIKLLAAPQGEKPLLIQVGSHVLYQEAHVPGSEYVGPASSAAGLEKLRQRLQSVARKTRIILYCGCCPWGHCPNIKPAWELSQSMGFSNVKVLYIAENFGTNWVDKGYPTAKGD
ncbi:MAG TPA: rhodanese-like domain-containing protein [Terriglobales bacterium]